MKEKSMSTTITDLSRRLSPQNKAELLKCAECVKQMEAAGRGRPPCGGDRGKCVVGEK
jgi:hypothetical protein